MKNHHAGCGRQGDRATAAAGCVKPGCGSLVILIKSRPHGVVMDSNVKHRRICSAQGGLSRTLDATDLGIAMAIWCPH
jgi:hypothetical protein